MKAIASVQPGDWVKSRNEATGQDEARQVMASVKRLAPAVVTVSLADSKTGKAETLTCTPEHTLFVQGQGWVEAGSVGIGTSIVSRAGPALEVTNLTWEKNKAEELAAGTGSSFGGYTVYNLTVEGDHTFFVGTANGGTWVHNALPCDAQEAYNATQAPDKVKGFTIAGRSLTKHNPVSRPGSNYQYPVPSGNPSEINAQADAIVQDILTDPQTSWTGRIHNRLGPVVEYRAPNGQSLLFHNNGFEGFRD